MTKRKNFTLVELLVVVAILALLASLMLPALQSAIENGRQTVCVSNLKQIGNGFHLYAEDWNNCFPRTRYLKNEVNWSNQIQNQDGWPQLLAKVSLNVNLPDSAVPALLQNQMPTGTPFVCPTMNSRMWKVGRNVGSGPRFKSWNNYSTYFGNLAWSSDLAYKKGITMTSIGRSDFPLVLDVGLGSWDANQFAATYPDYAHGFHTDLDGFPSFPGFWHGEGGAALTIRAGSVDQLCLDGSVRIINSRDVPSYWVNKGATPGQAYFEDLNRSQPLP